VSLPLHRAFGAAGFVMSSGFDAAARSLLLPGSGMADGFESILIAVTSFYRIALQMSDRQSMRKL